LLATRHAGSQGKTSKPAAAWCEAFVIPGIMAKNVCWKCSFSLYFVYDIDKKVKPF